MKARKVKVYDEIDGNPNILRTVGQRVLHEGRFVYVDGERWLVRSDKDIDGYVLDYRLPER